MLSKFMALPLLLVLFACENHASHSSSAPSAQSENTMASTIKQQVQLTGTIEYKNFEGGFYALEAKDGQSYLLMDLSSRYQRHGLVVEVTGQLQPDTITFQQYGTPFKVEAVTILDDSNARKSQADQL
ncbi:hypothetical protein HMF8227_01007 [Saliniradius amylolyticus]|uniref:Bacterial OB-fold domain-containing protein n=1 Tax=Saliniradius amylolyticus TaxID=2183582 RepID=A0A2S2E1I8_9ALTE|nr:hypothetical protein [Saliniradius amylolyticus]AWL11496.1 hypothetical protein HMF8227_01007 [Saliniradius amylolyticus]